MRILIAEDDPVIGLALTRRVEALGHTAIGLAGDGEEAIALARSAPPDLYLFDIDMPRRDGLSAASALADLGLRRPVVVITGVEDPGLIDRCIATGVSAYLAKPVNDRELAAAIALAEIRHREFRDLEAEVTEARQALADRKLVERAKAVLITSAGLSEPDAFRRIQRAARDRNLRLVEMARVILDGAELLAPPADGESPSAGGG
ncbi:ANTAR domain-containing response regulator [Conexibacter sp. DBS9H8]|uniref:ANTAR domain-containing response regulator n=1 Tax=Conexibacter sp. DBS9H8 TaxID=2937801 RepID=UPI00200CCD32|nr:response regulator [Conexibacter sp. DBS9H8]